MKRTRIKMLSVLMMGGCLLGSGCSFDSLLRNIWNGFGMGVGAIPAQVVVDALRDALGLNEPAA